MEGPSPVWFYIPNLIGYARVVLSLAAFSVFFEHPWWFSIFYMSSFLLDAADGYAARSFNQCSKFGAVLDMVTDRFSTAAFLMLLSHLDAYSSYIPRLLLVLLNILDLSSHWFQMCGSYMCGAQSHKAAINPILRLYYTSRPVLSIVCLGQEVFYFFLYLSAQQKAMGLDEYSTLISLGLRISFPIFLFKQMLNFMGLAEATAKIVALDSPNAAAATGAGGSTTPGAKGRARSVAQ